MKRRAFLGLSAVAAGAMLTGCDTLEQQLTRQALPPNPLPPLETTRHTPAVRLLNRLAYGPRPGDIARVERMGLAAYVDEQLAPKKIAEDERLAWRLRPLGDMLNAAAGDLFDVDDHQLIGALRQSILLRAVYSRCQLQERMAEFWRDHFNLYAYKGSGPQWSIGAERDVIQAHALGRFRDLLGASAHSAAMLGYLDNDANVKGIPNENYGRELMELHTLGVHAGYTQRDVQEAARCLTGWATNMSWFKGRFQFDAAHHDNGVKHVLGATFPAGGGVHDGEHLLDMLAAHPATARHIASKLCVRFLGYASENWVTRLAEIWQQTDGDISALLRPLLLSSEILTGPPILKRPFDYTVSALRGWNADTDGGSGVQAHVQAMGQPQYGWPMPNGFPDEAQAWVSTLIPRWNFAADLTAGKISHTHIDWEGLSDAARTAGAVPADALLELACGCRPSDPCVDSLRRCAAMHPDIREYAALVLMSPQFQWR